MGKRCICGNRRTFSNCCEPYLKSSTAEGSSAPTAEALMRSRYTAFVLGNIDYLIATHHADYRPNNCTDLQQTLRTTQWVNLIVLNTQKGQRKDKSGTVEFVAAYRPKQLSALSATKASDSESSDALAQLHERSRFVREESRWFYTEGDRLPPYQPKRAQPCWCGSDLKFKQCHGS